MIVVNGAAITLVSAFIYEHYFHVNPPLGLPTASQTSAPGGGLSQSFQGGDIYWRSDTGAAAVRGAIRSRWRPRRGWRNRLSNLRRAASGARWHEHSDRCGESIRKRRNLLELQHRSLEVTGNIRQAYEQNYGGPSAPNGFGFPLGALGTSSVGTYTDFQNGVIVDNPSGTYMGTWGFQDLQLFMNRFEAPDEDCVPITGPCFAPDFYVNINLTSSDGLSLSLRRPSSGTYHTLRSP